MLERLVALDVAAGLQAVHAGHAPVHEDDVVRARWRPAALTAAMASGPEATTFTRLGDGAERLLQNLPRGGVVIHHQHAQVRELLGDNLARALSRSRRRARR